MLANKTYKFITKLKKQLNNLIPNQIKTILTNQKKALLTTFLPKSKIVFFIIINLVYYGKSLIET